MSALRRTPASLGMPIGVSALLHAALAFWLVAAYSGKRPELPPIYRVNLLAAPPGERAAGLVTVAPAPETPTKAPAAPEKSTPRLVKAPTKGPARKSPNAATPNVTPKSAPVKSAAPPKAGGGPEGGAGTDVATVRTEGIEFPFPGYLNNIVRQIALNFTPPPGVGAMRAEVMFLIRRDGSVSNFRFLARSGSYAFDLVCQGAVEATARANRFGPLPAGFADDVLPVIFSFDPRRMR